MIRESLKLLGSDRGGLFVDCTLGLGGHAAAILEAHPSSRVLGVDRDAEEMQEAAGRLARFGDRFRAAHSDYRDIARWSGELDGQEPDGILLDLGFSRYHLMAGRGFSFKDGDALDMRMDRSSGAPVSAFVNAAPEDEMARVFREYGEEQRARRIAAAIVARRVERPFADAADLASVVALATPARFKNGPIHPATRVFQALRIFTNRELDGLDAFLSCALDLLRSGGRLVVIAYHSLEDRIVKRTFRDFEGACVCPPRLPLCACGRVARARAVTRSAMRPTQEETLANPPSRSARLRAVEKA
jgi:16S rRNA (cytosine1402-N4)-methyltransferase